MTDFTTISKNDINFLVDSNDNRLVIYSPGGMFDGSQIQDRDLNEVPSKRRNPILADVFTQFGYMEKRGSGLRKIRNETAKLPGFTNEKRPSFRSQYESFFTEILNNNYEQESQGEIQDVVKDVVKEILSYIESDRFITAETLSKKLSMSSRQVQRLLAQLQKDNVITRKGGRKAGHWEVTCPPNVPLNVPQDGSINVADVVKDVAINENDVVKKDL